MVQSARHGDDGLVNRYGGATSSAATNFSPTSLAQRSVDSRDKVGVEDEKPHC